MQGRSGKTGIATTFVNSRQCSESILLDLKHLLKEAKQRVPHFLTVRPTDGSSCKAPCVWQFRLQLCVLLTGCCMQSWGRISDLLSLDVMGQICDTEKEMCPRLPTN